MVLDAVWPSLMWRKQETSGGRIGEWAVACYNGTMEGLKRESSILKGIGKKRQEQLEKLGIRTVEDLLCYVPRTYRDLTTIKTVEEMRAGEEWFGILTILEDGKAQYIRRNFSVVRVRAGDASGAIHLAWYNQPYLATKIQEGMQFYVYGRPEYIRGEVRMVSPMLETLSETEGKRLLPVYRSTQGLSQRILRSTVKHAFQVTGESLALFGGEEFRKKWGLLPLERAYYQAHFPVTFGEKDAAIDTIAFYEMLLLRIYLHQAKPKAEGSAKPFVLSASDVKRFDTQLIFQLTGAQKRVKEKLLEKLSQSTPLEALLQGDVGSGKTIVVFFALYCSVVAGYQGALLAPTEIVCNQHMKNARAFFQPMGIRVESIRSGMKKRERQSVLERLAAGEIDILIGTHAMLEEDVIFQKLAIGVTDEQHRFGVRQRAALMRKGEGIHTIVMSATPIPRTLALLLYGDLDLMILDEMPRGRQPVKTHLVPPHQEERMLGFLRQQITMGNQVYYVCPVIEESDLGLVSVDEAEQKIRGYLPEARIETLHGRMRQGEKDALMERFSEGEIDILVSTTVVEVGVDVKSATVMVIENAERFGMAQLHQLRGRVGRSDKESFCFLLGGKEEERLKEFAATTDGFQIAQADLERRGPGALMGQMQHGKSDLFFLHYATNGTVLERVLAAYQEIFTDDVYGEEFQRMLEQRAQEKYAKKMEDIVLN